jgi:hypothetical protein
LKKSAAAFDTGVLVSRTGIRFFRNPKLEMALPLPT